MSSSASCVVRRESRSPYATGRQLHGAPRLPCAPDAPRESMRPGPDHGGSVSAELVAARPFGHGEQNTARNIIVARHTRCMIPPPVEGCCAEH